MNKIYKVVWSKVKNCYVVVSELAKNVITGSVKSAKIGSTPMAKGLALGAVMAFVITGNVWAADYTERIGNNVNESYYGDTFKEIKTTGKLGIWQGGVLNVDGSKTVSFTNCVFEGNEFSPERVNANDHGKVHGGVIYNQGTVIIDDCIFTDNKMIAPSDAYGAAISNNGGNMTITGSEFRGNTTERVGTTSDSRGSAIHNSGTIRIEDSVIANSSGGRAVYNSAGTATLSGNTFSNNVRGAVQTEVDASVIFEGENIFQDNGGNSIKNKGVATFKEGSVTTFTNNEVDIDNFGVVNVQKDSTVTMGRGMTGAGTVNVAGTLGGRIYVNEEDAASGANKVALSGGTWNVKGDSEVASISGNGYEVSGTGENTLTVVNNKNDGTTNSNGVYSVGSATISDLKELNVTSNRHALEVATDMEISNVGTVNLTSNVSNGIMVYGNLDINDVDVLNIEATNSHGIRASKDDNHSADVNINVKELNITAQKEGETALKGSDGAKLDVVATEKADIKGDIEAKGGAAVGLTLNGAEASLTGAVKTEDGAQTTLTMNDGATWYVDGDSDLSVLAGSGANIKVGDGVSKINVGDNQNDDVNVSKDANGSVVTDKDLADLKNVLQGDVADMNIDATLTNAAITGDVTLDAEGNKITTLDTKLVVNDGLQVKTNGNGKITVKDIAGNTMLYGTDAEGNYTVGINAETGGVESKHINVGNGAFVANETGAAVKGGLTVDGNQAITGGLEVGTDVIAQGDVKAGEVSLKETAEDVEALEEVTQNITAAEGKTTFKTSGNGKITIKDIAGNTMLYGTDAEGNYTVGINAETGGVESKHINVGNGAFVANETGAAVKGSLTVDGNQAITGGLEVGTDVVAQGDVKAGGVSLKETADRVTDVEDRVGNVENRVGAVEGRVEAVENKNAEQDTRIEAVEDRVGDVENRVGAVEGRVEAVENKNAEQDTRIEAVEDRTNAVENRVGAVEDRVGAIEADNGAQNERIGAVENRVGSVEVKNGEQDNRIAAVEDKNAEQDTRIAATETRIGQEEQTRASEDQRIESKFDGEVNRLDNRIDKVDAKIDKVGAMAAAMASLKTMGYDPEAPTEIAVGIGQYRNETGIAIGAFHYPNKDFMLNFSLSTAGDEVMGGIGATWKIGRKKPAGETMEDKVAKAEAIKEAAKEARVKAQQAKHAKMLAAQAK